MNSKPDMQKRIGELEAQARAGGYQVMMLKGMLLAERKRNATLNLRNFFLRRKRRNRLWLRLKGWWRK